MSRKRNRAPESHDPQERKDYPSQSEQMGRETRQLLPPLSAGLFFLVHAALLGLCTWIKSWWNEPLGIDGLLLFIVLSFIIQLFCPRLRRLMSRWP